MTNHIRLFLETEANPDSDKVHYIDSHSITLPKTLDIAIFCSFFVPPQLSSIV